MAQCAGTGNMYYNKNLEIEDGLYVQKANPGIKFLDFFFLTSIVKIRKGIYD